MISLLYYSNENLMRTIIKNENYSQTSKVKHVKTMEKIGWIVLKIMQITLCIFIFWGEIWSYALTPEANGGKEKAAV